MKPKLKEIGPISGRKQKKMRATVKELQRMKLLRKRMELDKRIQENTQKSPVRKVILYPPIPPPPAPGMSAGSSSSGAAPSRSRLSPRRRRSTKRPLKPANSGDTIVIDSEDDCAVFQLQHPLFYVDTTGGFNDKEVPRYDNSATGAQQPSDEPSVMIVEESLLEEGEIRDEVGEKEKTSILNRRVNDEEIPISEDEDDDGDVVGCDKSTVPKPKQLEDESVVFCSEVIDLDREETRKQAEPLDFIPIWFDMEGVGSRDKLKRSPRRKIFQDLEKKKKGQTKKGDSAGGNAAETGEGSAVAKRFVVIDGNNVAYAHTHGQAFSVKGLDICIQYFKKMGHEVKAVVPQYRLKKDKSTDQKLLEDLYKKGDIILAPSKNLPGQKSSCYDDRLIISVAEKFDGVVISNDNFRDLLAENDSWKKIIETRVAGYTWAMDAFFLPDDPYGRKGPSLAEMLQVNPSAPSASSSTSTKEK